MTALAYLGARVMCRGGQGESATRMPGKTRTNREPAQEQDKQVMETSLETHSHLY